eukprot:14254051-Alexandrium_andersonii.AAC.2
MRWQRAAQWAAPRRLSTCRASGVVVSRSGTADETARLRQDRTCVVGQTCALDGLLGFGLREGDSRLSSLIGAGGGAVSYTHLTLPTICSV